MSDDLSIRRLIKDGHGELRNLQGYRPDRPMPPGHYPTLVAPVGVKLAASFLSPFAKLVPLLNQLDEGSCTGHGTTEALMHEEAKDGPVVRLSPQNCYKRTRMLEGTPLTEDSGAEVGDAVKVSHLYGICEESLDPYHDDKSHYSMPITPEQAANALKHRLGLSLKCNSVMAAKYAIAQGFTVVFGFTCFEGLMSPHAAKTGEIPSPEKGENNIGGHCMIKMGWDDTKVINKVAGAWIVRQSWGEWGAELDDVRGYGYLPYHYQEVGLDSDNHSPRLLMVA